MPTISNKSRHLKVLKLLNDGAVNDKKITRGIFMWFEIVETPSTTKSHIHITCLQADYCNFEDVISIIGGRPNVLKT